jgi:hypothetical protein
MLTLKKLKKLTLLVVTVFSNFHIFPNLKNMISVHKKEFCEKEKPKYARFQLFVTIIDQMQIYNLQLTRVTQALNTRTHTNHTVVTTGSTKIGSQKWKNYLVSVAF